MDGTGWIIIIIVLVLMGIVLVSANNKASSAMLQNVPSVLPDAIINEIKSGRLPIINANKLFLKRGELCHFADHAIFLEKKKRRVSRSYNYGHSSPGVFKGTRLYMGGSESTSEEVEDCTMHKGSLYITNMRIIFNSDKAAFDKPLKDLSSIKPYTNAVELQFGQKLITLSVPDGAVVYSVIQMLQ